MKYLPQPVLHSCVTVTSAHFFSPATAAIRRLILLTVSIYLSGCALQESAGTPCHPGETIQTHDRLYFGTDRAGGRVTDAEWADFLATSVTPQFPEGLTVISGRGQWRSDHGHIVHEQSHVLSLIHKEGSHVEPAISEIIRTYKQRFQQESVLRVRTNACISFR